jgi:hypothetical protein
LDFLRAHQAVRLSRAAPGTPMRVLCISEVVEDETALLRSLGDKGIRPGVEVSLREAAPDEAGQVVAELNGRLVSLSQAVAEKIWVYHSP